MGCYHNVVVVIVFIVAIKIVVAITVVVAVTVGSYHADRVAGEGGSMGFSWCLAREKMCYV
jgi:hypothetical protein